MSPVVNILPAFYTPLCRKTFFVRTHYVRRSTVYANAIHVAIYDDLLGLYNLVHGRQFSAWLYPHKHALLAVYNFSFANRNITGQSR